MLCYVLDHLYTSRSRAALSVDALKGADATRAQVAITAAAQSDVGIALVRLKRREDGEAEESEDTYGHDCYSEDESDSEGDSSDGGNEKCGKDGRPVSSGSDHGMMDVYEIDDIASEWVTVTGGQLGFNDIALKDGCMLQDWHFWRHVQPSSRMGEGYTGNEGSPLSLWYTQTALVMWRKRDNIVMQLQGTGFTPLIQYLTQLVARMQHLQQQQQQTIVGQTAQAQAAGSANSAHAESSPAAAAAAAAVASAAAAAAAGPPAYDGERQLLLLDINVLGTAELCWTAAQELAWGLMTHHEIGGSMSSTELAQLLCVLAPLNNPYLLETCFFGPFKAATAHATSCMKSKVAANGYSVFYYVTTASGGHFNWADLEPALVQCCSAMPWEQMKEWWMPILKEYLVIVRDMKLTSADDDQRDFWSRDKSHRNPLAFEAAYSQVVALVLQLMGQHIRAGTAAVLKQHCTHITELSKIPGTKYHYNDDLYTTGDYSDEASEECPDNDSNAKYKFGMAVEAAVKEVATAAEAAAVAGSVLPSAGALSDFHNLVSCDPGPDQITSGLSGLPGWQVQVCKDMLGVLLEVMEAEDGNAWPVDMRQTDYRDREMPIIHMLRDAGLLLSLLQAVYVLGSEQQLLQLVQHITRQPRLYDPTATVAPAALEFCHWLGDSRLAESPGAGQLLKDCLTSLQQLTTGGSPDGPREKWRVTNHNHLRLCSPNPDQPKCKPCEALEEFLASGAQRSWKFRGTRKDRDHLRGVVPPYITWSQQQFTKHAYMSYPTHGPQPGSSSATQAAQCPVEVLSDTDDPESRQPETVRRAEQAAVAAVRTSQKRGSRSRYNDRSTNIKPPEYVPGRRAPGMSAAKEAAMARIGELTIQKKTQPFQKRLQQYRDYVDLLSSLRAVASRLGWATPSAAGAGTSAAAAEAMAAVKQEGDIPDVKLEQAAAAASGQERTPPAQDVKQEQLVSTYCSGSTAAVAAAAGGGATAVETEDQAMPPATMRRGRLPRSSSKRERSPAAPPAADAPVTRSRTAAVARAAGTSSKRAKKGRK